MNTDFIFVSGNLKKVEYLEKFLGQKVEHHHLDLDEIQSLDSEKIVEHKAKEAYKVLHRNVLVEDVSLKISALGGLPGPFVKFFLQTIGTEGICMLVSNFSDKSAKASVNYGFYDGKKLTIFSLEVDGLIPSKPRGKNGMGWDAAFIPANQDKTYAEMGGEALTKYSIRNKAIQKLKTFLENGGE